MVRNHQRSIIIPPASLATSGGIARTMMWLSLGVRAVLALIYLPSGPLDVLAASTPRSDVAVGQGRWPASQRPFLSHELASPANLPKEHRSSTNLTDAVEWDGYSLFVKGQRVFVWSVTPRRFAFV